MFKGAGAGKNPAGHPWQKLTAKPPYKGMSSKDYAANNGTFTISSEFNRQVDLHVLDMCQRGDHVTFLKMLAEYFIKVSGGVLHINGEPVQRETLSRDELPAYAGQSTIAKLYRETLPNGRQHLIRELGDDRHYDNTREYVVPPGHYFFMGDNRDQSEDSRATVGMVPHDNLVGRAEFLFFSQNGESSFWEFWRWPTTIRWSRLFNGIE